MPKEYLYHKKGGMGLPSFTEAAVLVSVGLIDTVARGDDVEGRRAVWAILEQECGGRAVLETAYAVWKSTETSNEGGAEVADGAGGLKGSRWRALRRVAKKGRRLVQEFKRAVVKQAAPVQRRQAGRRKVVGGVSVDKERMEIEEERQMHT